MNSRANPPIAVAMPWLRIRFSMMRVLKAVAIAAFPTPIPANRA